MMEEVNDDANGESSFEFVGGKTDDAVLKGHGHSPAKTLDNVPPPPVDSTANPTPSLASHLFTTPPGSSWNAVPQASLTSPRQQESSVANVPMMNPSMSPGAPPPPMPFPAPLSTTPQMYQPVQAPSPYIPPGQGYLPQPPSVSSPGYFPPSSVPQAAYELPFDDSYTSKQPEGSGDQGVWGWIKGNEFLNKVAEKAKSSVDSVITTLDPGMKEIIYSGGNINIVVASGSEAKVSAVREAFQQAFGKATIESIAVQSTSIAPQPVGFSAATKAAEERISNLRQQGLLSEDQVIIAIENFLAELTPDKWFDIGCLLLQDPSRGITLQVYTQAIPVATHFVMQAREQTSPDYPLGWSGFAITIGQVLGPALGVPHSQWHQALTGTSRRDILLLAAKSLAGLYKAQRNTS